MTDMTWFVTVRVNGNTLDLRTHKVHYNGTMAEMLTSFSDYLGKTSNQHYEVISAIKEMI